MNKNIEKENKFLISEEEFIFLLDRYKKNKKVINQNHYFDTLSYTLMDSGISLRIRETALKAELTIKKKILEKESLHIKKEQNVIIDKKEVLKYIETPSELETIFKLYEVCYEVRVLKQELKFCT